MGQLLQHREPMEGGTRRRREPCLVQKRNPRIHTTIELWDCPRCRWGHRLFYFKSIERELPTLTVDVVVPDNTGQR